MARSRNRRIARDQFSGKWVFDLVGDIVNPGKDDRRAAREAQQNATDLWLGLGNKVPTADEISTENRQANAIKQELTSSIGRESEAAQLNALRQMQGIANAGGYTNLERDQIRQAQQQAAQYEQSQRMAALQQMQARGMAGGGGELAGRLQAQQSGANRAANDATNVATAAQQRALQAMQAGAQIGNQAQQTGMRRADAINAFNQSNAQARGNAVQQTFQNRANVLAGATGQFNANADSLYDNANRQAAQAQSLLTTAVGALV